MSDGDNVWVQGFYGKSLYLPLNFFCEPKNAFFKKYFKIVRITVGLQSLETAVEFESVF